VGEIGTAAGVPTVTAGRDIPWLQDTAEENVWVSWAVTYRDVVVLDGCNHVYAVYNLTAHDLSVPANYDELMALLLAASAAQAK
jgi:hypothetical protein